MNSKLYNFARNVVISYSILIIVPDVHMLSGKMKPIIVIVCAKHPWMSLVTPLSSLGNTILRIVRHSFTLSILSTLLTISINLSFRNLHSIFAKLLPLWWAASDSQFPDGICSDCVTYYSVTCVTYIHYLSSSRLMWFPNFLSAPIVFHCPLHRHVHFRHLRRLFLCFGCSGMKNQIFVDIFAAIPDIVACKYDIILMSIKPWGKCWCGRFELMGWLGDILFFVFVFVFFNI